MSVEYKQKEDIINLYGILGLTIDVCQKPNCNELIRDAYFRKAKLCHPDKCKGKPELQELFLLIKGAFEILSDEKQRQNYNNKLKLEKQSTNSFFKLKKTAKDYADNVYSEATDTQKLSFKEQMKLMDKKYETDSTGVTMSKADAKKKLQSRVADRKAQDVELRPENIFEGGKFDAKKFNRAFDLNKEADTGGGDLMLYGGVPSAWNDMGRVANFSNFDDLNNLFVEDSTRLDVSKQSYGSIDNMGPAQKIKLTKEFVSQLEGADYYDQHNHIDDSYYTDLKNRLSSRGSEQQSIENMSLNDFKRDDTAGYGIYDQLGLKYEDRLSIDMENEDIATRFEKIMAERKKSK